MVSRRKFFQERAIRKKIASARAIKGAATRAANSSRPITKRNPKALRELAVPETELNDPIEDLI
jgi:hypothetical protein